MKSNILSLIFSFLSLYSTAQTAEKAFPKWAIVANIGHQDQGINFSFGSLQVIHKVSFRPNVGVGIERTWVNKSKFRLYQDLQLSYFHDTYVEKVYGLASNVGFEYKIFKGLRFTPRICLGYNVAKANDIRYKLEGDKWVKAENTDPSVSRLNIKSGADLSYRFGDKIDVIAGGHYALITPHLPDGLSAIYLYKGVQLGVRYFL